MHMTFKKFGLFMFNSNTAKSKNVDEPKRTKLKAIAINKNLTKDDSITLLTKKDSSPRCHLNYRNQKLEEILPRNKPHYEDDTHGKDSRRRKKDWPINSQTMFYLSPEHQRNKRETRKENHIPRETARRIEKFLKKAKNGDSVDAELLQKYFSMGKEPRPKSKEPSQALESENKRKNSLDVVYSREEKQKGKSSKSKKHKKVDSDEEATIKHKSRKEKLQLLVKLQDGNSNIEEELRRVIRTKLKSKERRHKLREITQEVPSGEVKSHQKKHSSRHRKHKSKTENEPPVEEECIIGRSIVSLERERLRSSKKRSKRSHMSKDIEPGPGSSTKSDRINSKSRRSTNCSINIIKNTSESSNSQSFRIDCSQQLLEQISKVNSDRHKNCIIETFLSVVNIPPLKNYPFKEKSVEEKKASSRFRHYYCYDHNREEPHQSYNNFHTFSDSHKNYQSHMEQIEEEASKKERKAKKVKYGCNERVSASRLGKTKKRVLKSRIPIFIARKRGSKTKNIMSKVRFEEINEDESVPNLNLIEKKVSRKLSSVKNKSKKKKDGHLTYRKGSAEKLVEPSKEESKNLEVPITDSNDQEESNRSVNLKQSSSSVSEKNNNVTLKTKSSQHSVLSRKSCSSQSLLLHKKAGKKLNNSERFSMKGSRSNSTIGTIGDKSAISARNQTSMLLTKSFNDDDKLTRWKRQKSYSDQVRRKVLSKLPKPKVVPSQIVEVNYMSIENNNPQEVELKSGISEVFIEDMPHSTYPIQLLPEEKFEKLFAAPTDKALEEILKENDSFLKKDFSVVLPQISSSSSSEECEVAEEINKDWISFCMEEHDNLCQIMYSRQQNTGSPLTLRQDEHILGLFSAPASEESGYSTTKSVATTTANFFERPSIRDLMRLPPPEPCESSSEGTTESQPCSSCSLDQSLCKSIQAVMASCSQKSTEIQTSQEGISTLVEEQQIWEEINIDQVKDDQIFGVVGDSSKQEYIDKLLSEASKKDSKKCIECETRRLESFSQKQHKLPFWIKHLKKYFKKK